MSVKSNSIFEPALLLELIFLARQSQAEQRKADGHKWDLAERVNSECSHVSNQAGLLRRNVTGYQYTTEYRRIC